MDVKWHLAFSNVVITEYAATTYRDYYASPANMLEAQLKAKEVVEKRFGIGDAMPVFVDRLPVTFTSVFGMPYLESEADELPYIDSSKLVLRDPEAIDSIDFTDFLTKGLLGQRLKTWEYFRSHGYNVPLGGLGAPIVTTLHELSGGNSLMWMFDAPDKLKHLLDVITDIELKIRNFGESLSGGATGAAYTGDDFSGLLSPEMYREFAIPQYQRIYAGRTSRFMHSELLRAEHLRIAKDQLDITAYHGAECKNLTLEEMYDIMGNDFWTQITPQQLLELSPQAIKEKIKKYADCGCGFVQLYPGRNTPDENMRAAIVAVQQECGGGRLGAVESND